MFCPNCGAQNREGSTFCGRCGTKLAAPAGVGGAPAAGAQAPSTPAVDAPAGGAPFAGRPAASEPTAGPMRTEEREAPVPAPTYAPAPESEPEHNPRAVDANPRTRKARKERKPAKKRSKAPVIVAVLVLVIAAVGAFAFFDPLHIMPWTNAATSDAPKDSQSDTQADDGRISISVDDGASKGEGDGSSEDAGSDASNGTQSSSSSSTDGTGLSLTEEDPDRISPKESIEITNLEIKEDAVKRYVLTGTITNKNKEAYDVNAYLSFTRHYFDSKYHEPSTEDTHPSLQTADPFTRASGDCVTFYDLKPGSRSFTLYPNWNSAEETLSDPQMKVDSVALPDAREQWRFDHKGDIHIGDTKLEADGTLAIDFTNNTGLYLNSATITVAAYNDQDLLAVESNSGKRPYGIKTFELSAEALKPDDKDTFKRDIGEGYSKVKIVDVRIEPDPNKNSFN